MRTFLEADPRKQLLDGLWPLDDARRRRRRRRPPLRPPPPPPRAVPGGGGGRPAAATDRVGVVDGEDAARRFLGEDLDVDELEVADARRALPLPQAARVHRYDLDEVSPLKCNK